MRNIAEILKDDRNGKQLSQTERQIAVAYSQGKYDAVRELKIGNNSNINEILGKIRAEIEGYNRNPAHYPVDMISIENVLRIIDKYDVERNDRDDR